MLREVREIQYLNYKLCCEKCGRKILVEMTLFGIPHHLGVTAICGECIDIEGERFKEFAKNYPEEARAILDWLTEKS